MVEYIKDSFNELKNNVTWPTWQEAQSLTVLVATFSVIFALVIWGIDTVFGEVIQAYFNWIS